MSQALTEVKTSLPCRFDLDRKYVLTNTFALVSVNTLAEDPTLSIEFFDENGDVMCVDCPLEISRSALGPQ